MTVAERAIPVAVGLLMVAATVPEAPQAALVAAAISGLLVVVGSRYETAAVPAVLATLAALVIGYPSATMAALSGTAAAIYVLTTARLATLTRPSVIGAVVCTGIALVAASIPIAVAWLPLLAPIAIVLLFAGLARPFRSVVRR